MANPRKSQTSAKFLPKSVISLPNGNVRKVFPNHFESEELFRELYISEIRPYMSKKWKMNLMQSQNITVAWGKLSVICIEKINSQFVYEEFLIDCGSNHGVLIIPKGLIYGLFAAGEGAVIINALEKPYSESDSLKIDSHFSISPEYIESYPSDNVDWGNKE